MTRKDEMARKRSYKRIDKEQRVALAEAEALSLSADLLQHDIAIGQLDAIPEKDRGEVRDDKGRNWQELRDAAEYAKAQDEKRVKAVEGHANALRGEPLRGAKKKEQARAVLDQQVTNLEDNLRNWEAAAAAGERDIAKAEATGDDPGPDERRLATLDRAIAAGEQKLAELKAQLKDA